MTEQTKHIHFCAPNCSFAERKQEKKSGGKELRTTPSTCFIQILDEVMKGIHMVWKGLFFFFSFYSVFVLMVMLATFILSTGWCVICDRTSMTTQYIQTVKLRCIKIPLFFIIIFFFQVESHQEKYWIQQDRENLF